MSLPTIVLFAIASGYVTAGLLASIYRLFADQPISFRLLTEAGLVLSMAAVPLLLFAGPVVLARNSWRGRIIEGRPWRYIAAAGGLILAWSFVNGVLVIEFLLLLRGMVA